LQLANRQVDLNSAVEQIWKGKGSELMRPIFDTYNDDLHRAVASDSEETAKLFKNNVSRLAAAKANYTIQQLERCKADINGVARSKEEYKKAAKTVIGRANRAQAAEYNTTSHRCRVAKQWAQFTKEKRLFPNIEWLRTRSANPRDTKPDDHLSFVGRRWHIDDDFLKKNYPGCLWNCKCNVKNTDKPVTDNADLKDVPAAAGLEGNPYYTNEIFSSKHPYFSRVNKHIPDVGVLYNSDDIAYLNKEENGVKFKLHYNAQKEFNDVNKPYLPLIKKAGFNDIKFLPTVERHEKELRKRYFGKYWETNKCADMTDGQLFIELKTVGNSGRKTRRNIITEIGDAAKKADIVILKSEKQLDFNQIAKSQFEKYTNLQRIIFFFNDEMFDFIP